LCMIPAIVIFMNDNYNKATDYITLVLIILVETATMRFVYGATMQNVALNPIFKAAFCHSRFQAWL